MQSKNSLQFFVRTIFVFALILLPTIGLAPPNNSVGVSDFFGYYTHAEMIKERRLDVICDVAKMQHETEVLFPEVKDKLVVLVAEPPVSLVMLLPICLLAKDISLIVVKIFFVVCASVAIVLLADVYELKERQFQLTAILVAMSGPLWEVMRVTKPAVLVLLALALGLFMLKRNRPLMAAILFLPWTFKPQLLLQFLIQITVAGRLKFIVSLAAITLLLVVVSLPIVGAHNYLDWFNILHYAESHPQLNRPDLQATIHGQLLRVFVFFPGGDKIVSYSAIKTISLVCLAAAILNAAFLGYRSRKLPNSLNVAVVCLPLALLTSYYCHNYDLILLIPAIIAFFKLPAFHSMNKRMRWSCIALVVIAILPLELPFYTIIHYFYLQLGFVFNPFCLSLSILSCVFIGTAYHQIYTAAQSSPDSGLQPSVELESQ